MPKMRPGAYLVYSLVPRPVKMLLATIHHSVLIMVRYMILLYMGVATLLSKFFGCGQLARSENSTSNTTKRPLRRTAALDGLRGIACVVVYSFHVYWTFNSFVDFGWGVADDQRRWSQLPILNLFHAGAAMVSLFFVCSGYVLALKPLNLLHTKQQLPAYRALASTTFRRAMRLYLPAIIATFITMLMVYIGLWEWGRKYAFNRQYIKESDNHIPRGGTLTDQFLHWYSQLSAFVDIFNYYNKGINMIYYPVYDPHLWTVTMEYRSSLILMVTLLAASICSSMGRFFTILGVFCFAARRGRWEVCCFAGGALLCQIDILTLGDLTKMTEKTASMDEDSDEDFANEVKMLEDGDILDENYTAMPTSFTRVSTATILNAIWHKLCHKTKDVLRTGRKRWLVLFVCGLYLLSAPNIALDRTPGYIWIYKLTPAELSDHRRWPHTLGTCAIILAMNRSALLRAPFNTETAQYFGRISYSLYIVHGPMIHMVGFGLWTNLFIYLGKEGWMYWFCITLGGLILFVPVIISAHFFCKYVEGWTVTITRKVEQIMAPID